MKGKFLAHTNLMQIEETLKEHQPYAALVVSTTGLDNSSFSDHSPTRVVLKEFEYDEEMKSYKQTIGFDKMVKAPQSAIDKAIENTDNYDAFASGGIDRDKYIAGEGVLSVEEFQKEFASVISALKEDGSILIINGDRKFAENYLGKIGCADGIIELADNEKVVEQTRMTQEYFQKAGIVSKSARLEDLKNAIAEQSYGSFKDVKAREAQNKIIGGDNRIAVINNFITKYGRDEHILASEWQERQSEADAAVREDMSEKGKEKYKNGDLDEKFKTLVEQGTLKPDDILQGKSEFHKLINIIEDKDNTRGNKGIIIMHAASTGFESGKPPKSTGFPIQYTALVFKRGADGKLDMTQKPSGVSFNIEAPSKSFQNAIKNINDSKRPYDTFKETGIDLEEYKAKVNVTSADDATARVNKLFKKYPIEDYAIIAIGGTKGSKYSFTQTCMSNLGNFAMCEADYIDFAQVIKDYSYLAHVDDSYPKNAIFDEFAFDDNGAGSKTELAAVATERSIGRRTPEATGRTFSIRDVAEARGDVRPASTQAMCQETAKLIYLMESQQIELFRPEEPVMQKPKAAPSDEKSVEDSVSTPDMQRDTAEVRSSSAEWNPREPHTSRRQEVDDQERQEEVFIGDGYDNVEEPELSAEQLQTEEVLKNEAFREMLGDEIGFYPQPHKDNLENRASTRSRNLRSPSPLFDNMINERSGIARRDTELEKRDNNVAQSGRKYSSRGIASSHPMSSPVGSVPRGMDSAIADDRGRPNDRSRPATKLQSERQAIAPERSLTDMTRLLDIIEKQSAVINEMNNRLAGVVEQTTDRLMAVVERQDELTKLVVRTLADRANVQEKQDLFREPIQAPSSELASNMESRLESAIAIIDEVSNNVPTNRAQTHLLNAKQALSGAVSEIDRANREKRQRTAS